MAIMMVPATVGLRLPILDTIKPEDGVKANTDLYYKIEKFKTLDVITE